MSKYSTRYFQNSNTYDEKKVFDIQDNEFSQSNQTESEDFFDDEDNDENDFTSDLKNEEEFKTKKFDDSRQQQLIE